MEPSAADNQAQKLLQLPINLVDIVDVKRALRESEALEDFLQQASVRSPGKQPSLPRTSKTLDELARLNNLNLLKTTERIVIKRFLEQLADKAPVVHISFASDPSAAFTGKIVTWFRQQVHPHVLLQVGLQPSIAAGCVVRTPNKYFDLSLRKHFTNQRPALMASLKELR